MMPRFHSGGRAVLVAVIAAALFAPPLAVGLADLSGVGHRWFDLAAQFSAPATVAAVAVTLAFAGLRRITPAAVGGLVSLVCAAAAWPQAFPGLPPARPDAPTIRLYSANLFVRNDDTVALRASLLDARPDVVVLIETSDAQFAALETLLDDLPHRVASPRIGWRGGGVRTVIASRWPLGPLRQIDGLHAESVVVDGPLGPLTLTAAHLTRPWPYAVQWEQIRQTEALAQTTQAIEGAQVVAGDFNSVTDARIGKLFAAGSGLKPAPAFPGTWPAFLPSPLGIGIDNVWVSEDLTVVERSLGRRNGSDHRPVITVLSRAAR